MTPERIAELREYMMAEQVDDMKYARTMFEALTEALDEIERLNAEVERMKKALDSCSYAYGRAVLP